MFLVTALTNVAYAFFNYSRTGNISQIVTGNIYLHYNTSDTLTSPKLEPRSNLNPNTFIGFSIDDSGYVVCTDFTGFSSYFDIPVTFGAALNTETYRFFTGKLFNIICEFIPDDAQVSDYEPIQ